ncbi:hypothetical protein ACI65C_004266 [Semiaphis heraclei]
MQVDKNKVIYVFHDLVPAIIELLELHDSNEYEDKNQENCLILQREQVIQPQQQSSLQRQQPLQQLQSQLVQQSKHGQQPQHQQEPQFLQQFQNVQQLQNVSQIQNLQQPQIVPKTPVVGQPSPIQKPNSLLQSQIVQQQNNQYSPVATQKQSNKQPPPHTQQLLQQQLQQILLKNKNYPQRIVVLGNQPQQQQLSIQQPQRVVTSNSTGQQSQQMQCVVVTNTGQQPQQIQRVVVTGTGQQQQQQQQIQRVMVGNNGQQQPQQMQRVVTNTGQQMQQQQFQHVIIPGSSQQQSHQAHNVVTQTSIQQQPQQLQRVVVAPTGQQQVQRVVTSTSNQQQQHLPLAQQHQPVPQRIVIGQIKTSQQTQQMQSPSQNGAVFNQQAMQRPIGSMQQQQRVVITGQQQILKLTNQQQSQQQITLQKQLAHKLLQPTQQQQQQDVIKNQQQQLDEVKNQIQQHEIVRNQQQQQDIVKNQQQPLDEVKNQQQQQDLVKNQHQQDIVKKQQQQVPHQQLSQGIVVPLTQQQKNNLNLSNENLANELHIKQSHQLLQQLHKQPSQKHSQEQINKQLQQQKLKQKKEMDILQHQLKQPQRSGVIVGQLQQSEKPEPEKLKKQLEMQQQQRQKLQERLILQQRRQQQQKKLKEQQLQQKHQQQELREQVLLQQHLKQLQQQQLQEKLLLRQQASPENRFSLVVNGNQDQKIQDEENTINRCEKSEEAECLRHIEKATAAEKQYQLCIKQKNNEKEPVSEKDVVLSSSDDDDDETIRKQRNLLCEAERLVQEHYNALKVVLGSKYKAQYDEILRNWLASRLSREEFDREIRKVLYVSWIASKKHTDSDNNSRNASIKINNNSCSKKTTKKDAVTTIKEDNGSLIDSTAHKSPTLQKLAVINEDIDVNIEIKEVKAILAERVPLHNALVTSLINWMPLNCQWLEQRKARSQGVSVSGSPLRMYTYADVPQVRGPRDYWYPDVPGSLAHWYWPNNLPCKSSFVESIEHLSPKTSYYEQEKKNVADTVAASVLINPPSRKLLPLLMEVAENTEKLRRARQIQYQKRFPKKQNAKITKRLQWQRLQEQKRLATMVQLRDGCSKLLRELKKRLRCLANQENRLIERLRRLQISISRRRRQVLAQFKSRKNDLKSRLRKYFDRSYLEQPTVESHEHLHTDDSSIDDDETDDDENVNEEEPVQHQQEVHQLEKNLGNKKQFKTKIANHQSKPSVRAQRPQSTALTIRLLRDRQRYLATIRLLEVTKQERLQISSDADQVREVRNKNCPCGESDNKPCQYRRQIRQLRKKLRARELIAINKEKERELVRKAAETEKIDAKELQKPAAIETEKTNAETKKTKAMTKLTNRKNVELAKKNINIEAEEKQSEPSAKGKTINKISVKTNVTTNNNTSKKKTSLDTTNSKNVETKVGEILDNPDKRKHNIGIENCELLSSKSQKTRIDILGDPKNRIRPLLPKDKRSVVNVADAAARAAQAALAATKKTRLRKTRVAAAAAAAASAAATASTTATASSYGNVDNDRRASELMPPPPPPPPLLPSAPPKSVSYPRNPTIGSRYLQQQKFLLDRHRQLDRIRRDEEERRQRSQDERLRQDKECSEREVDETNMKIEDSSSPYILSSQQMRSKRQKVPVSAIRQDMNRVTDNEDQVDFSPPNRINTKNGEESQQFSDYYFYYGGDDYYSSDEESPGSSFIEPPFPPLMHDLRIDQLPRPTNRMPTAAVLPPGVRPRLQSMRLSNSNNHDAESSSASYNKPQVEALQERITIDTDHGRNINDPVQKESLDRAIEFIMHSKPLNSNTMIDTCKITESDESPPSSTKISNKSSKVLQNEVEVPREQQKMLQDKINDSKMLPERWKRRQDADRLSGVKETFDKVQQERQDNGNLISKTNRSTDWSKQVSITSVKKTNSYIKDKKKHLNNQLQQKKSIDKIIKTVPSSRIHDTREDVEELRSVQWKAPLTQWNKRPVEYEAVVKQRYPIQNKGNDLHYSVKEKVAEYTSTKFEVSKHHLNNLQQKLWSEGDRQKCERIKLQNMVFEYQKLVDTLPINEQLQHMNLLQQHLRPSENMIEKITVKYNPSVEQQQNSVASTSNSCIFIDDSTSLLNLPDDGQEQTILKRIGNLLLKIKNQQEAMIRNAVSSDKIKLCPGIVSNKFDVKNVEHNNLKNWHDLWPAYESKLNNEEIIDEKQRFLRTQELIDQYYFSSNDKKTVRSLEGELPAYQQLRTKQSIQSETSATPNIKEQQNLQNNKHNFPERQTCLEQSKRIVRIEQLEQEKHPLGHRQQLNEQMIQKSQNKPQPDSGVERTNTQQQRSQLFFKIGKFRISPTQSYDEQLPLHDQLLRRIMKKKNVQIIHLDQQQPCSKSTTMPETTTRTEITLLGDASDVNKMRQTSRGSRLWWSIIGLERQISPLVRGIDHQADLALTPKTMIPISNLPQLTRPQLDDKVASIIEIHPKRIPTYTYQTKLKNWVTPHLINMMTDDEERWMDQLTTNISQLDQQVDQHWKAMIDVHQQQIKLLLNSDKQLQWEKEKKRLERERRIQQLKKRTPFQALPVHHQQAHTLRAEGQMRQQQSEIPIIVIDDDDEEEEEEEESLNDTTIVGEKRDTHPHPVFIDDDLLKHYTETTVLYDDQHKGLSNQWMQLEYIRKAHQKQWELKITILISCKETSMKFWRLKLERFIRKMKNPNLIKALEQLHGGPFIYSERPQLQQQMPLSESQPIEEQPGILHRKQKPSQKQAVKNRSQKIPTEMEEPKTSMLIKKSKKTIKQKRSTLKLALQKRTLNKQREQKHKKQLPQHLNDSNKNQSKKSHEHQEAVNIRQLRNKSTVVVNEPLRKRIKRHNHQNQSKLLLQKKAVEQQEQFTTRWSQHSQRLMKIKTPALTLRHNFLLRNRIIQVNYNRNKRLLKQNRRSVPKKDINIDSTEMQIQQTRKNCPKLILKKIAYKLYIRRSLLQRRLDKYNERHPHKIDKQLEPPVSKTLIMPVRQHSITSLILPPLQKSTIKQQSLTSTVILSPQKPLTSIEQSTMSSIILKSQIPIQPYQPTSLTSVNQSCQKKQHVETKRQTLKQLLNEAHYRLKPLMEMWQLSLQMPGCWLYKQLDDIEQLRRKEFSNTPILHLKHLSGQQQNQEILQNNDVSVVMDSNTMAHCSLQQLQRIREHLDWRQQRLRDLIEDFLILICPEQHPMLSVISQQSSSCSVLIKLQQHSSTVEQINSNYSALLNLQSSSSRKHVQQKFSTYSLLLKLKRPITAKQQSLVYSTVLQLQQPPIPKQSSCFPMITTTPQLPTSKQQQSISFDSENLIHNSTSINNKPTHLPNNQIQEKRRLSSGDKTDDNCKRLKSSSKKRTKLPNTSINKKRSVSTKNTGIDKRLPIIDLVDSDDDIEILDSDSITESSNEASFGVQVSETSPLTIKFIKKKPLPCTQPVITNIENKSEFNDSNSVIKLKKNIKNIDLDKGLEKTHNKFLKEDRMMQLQEKGEDFKTLKSNKFEDNKTPTCEEKNIKDVVAGISGPTTFVGRPTQISVLVNRPKEASAVINEPSDGNNKIFKVAVVECTSSMISNVGSNCINVVPEGRNTVQIMGGVVDPTYVNNVDRTISVVTKLTEAAVSVIRKAPTAVPQNHQPAVDPTSTSMITPISNLKITKSMEKTQSNNNRTEDNIESIKKKRIVTTDHHCRNGTFSKTVRRYRRLNRTKWLETRGPALPTFQDPGFAQGTIEQAVHGRFMTTIMTMSAAYTIASYIPPPIPRIPFDYDSMYQPDRNVASTTMANTNVDNTNKSQNIKTANTPVTPLSTMMSWIKKTAEFTSNIACGNGHLWKGCARASGPTLMTLSKVTKEAISRNTAIRSRDTSSSHLTNIPSRLSRSSTKEPLPSVANLTDKSISATVSTSTISNSKRKQQITTKRSTSLTSSPPSVELHNRSKSALVVPSVKKTQQYNSVVQPIKRSASEAFSSVPLLTSEIVTDIADPALETKISTSKKMVQPQKRSKSAVTTTDTSIINLSSTLTKPSKREECLRPLKRSASVAEYVSPSITSKISDLSPPAVESPKRSKSAAVITSEAEEAAASNNNFIQPGPIKRSASMALSPPSVRQTNRSKSAVAISSPFNETSTIQSEPTLADATIPEFNILKTLPSASKLTAAPNNAKNNVLTNSVIETRDESDTPDEKTTTITDEEQRTVTVTRTICPTIPAPMDVTADACSLVTAACEQFIKSMVMELRLKTGRGAETLQLRRREAFAAAIAVDDEIRPFPDYCRTPVIGTTIVNPSTQEEINDVEKEQISSIVSRPDTKFICLTTDKPDHENEHRAVLKQQSVIADSKSDNKLSVLTVKTVIETQTTSSTTTTTNKLHCPTTITTDSVAKTRSSKTAIEGTSARTRGNVLLKKSRNSASTSESTIPSPSEQQTTGDRLCAKLIDAGNRPMSPSPVTAPETTAKPPSVIGEATKTLPKAMLTYKTSVSTRGFFVERSKSLWRPTFNRRQPFDTLVNTAIAANSTSSNKTFFSDDYNQDLNNDIHSVDTWGCYFGDRKMLPPVSRLNDFLKIADKPEMSSSKYHDGRITDGASTELPHSIRKLDDNNAQEQISSSNSLQQLIIMNAYCKRFTMELEEEMNQQTQEYKNGAPESQENYYQKFMRLQFDSSNKPLKHSIFHNSRSLINWLSIHIFLDFNLFRETNSNHLKSKLLKFGNPDFQLTTPLNV